MRQRNFRGWSKEENRYIYTKLDVVGGMMYLVFNGSGYMFGDLVTGKFLPVEIEESTGLKDCKGKEIYEGDVVYWDLPDNPGVDGKASMGKIKWNEDGFIVELVKLGYIKYGDDEETYERYFYGPEGLEFSWKDLEIIGNIHENPELLNTSSSIQGRG